MCVLLHIIKLEKTDNMNYVEFPDHQPDESQQKKKKPEQKIGGNGPQIWGFIPVALFLLLVNAVLQPAINRRSIKQTNYGSFIAKVDEGKMEQVVIPYAKDKASRIIAQRMDKMHAVDDYLLEEETISGEEFMKILNS